MSVSCGIESVIKELISINSTSLSRLNFIIIKFCYSLVDEASMFSKVFFGVFSSKGLELVFFIKPITKAPITRTAVMIISLFFIIF